VATFRRIAPIFAVPDLAGALDHYRRLGFATREYVGGGGGYGYATRDGVEIHLAAVRHLDPNATTSAPICGLRTLTRWPASGRR
jgi:hypothetical protein